MLRRVLAGFAAVALLTACGSTTVGGPSHTATSRPGPTAPASPPTTTKLVNVVATAIVASVPVYDAPGAADPVQSLDNPSPPYGTPLVFLVRDQQPPDWLHVLLPVRPNGSTGWIRHSDVELASHDFRMLVELGAHHLTVWQGDTVFDEEAIGIGRDTAPTPPGLYYTRELLKPDNPDGAYGPYAYGLSGYSDVIFNFSENGIVGDGRFAIHGTNDPASIGQSQGNGCIRISNEAITKLATSLPIGVPVEIRE